jgi:hypothetical protein
VSAEDRRAEAGAAGGPVAGADPGVGDAASGHRGVDDSAGATVRLDLAVDDDDDLRILRGALLAARATELSELQRRAQRLSLGYGTETARESMDEETRRLRRRVELLDRLVAAVTKAVGR